MDDGSAQHACGGSEVDHVVGAADRFLVVFDHHNGIPDIAHADQGVQEPSVVALVQTNRGFVEDVDHAGEFRAHLAGQANALGLASRKARSGTVQGEVAQSHGFKKAQPGPNLLEDFAGDFAIRTLQAQARKERSGFGHGEGRDVDDASLAQLNRRAFGS